MTKPALLMLLSRHPYAENSGRAVMLRQRIAQMRARFEPTLVVLGQPSGGADDAGLVFLPMAGPADLALNAVRLSRLPLQTWLYYSGVARARIAQLLTETDARAVYVDMLRLAPLAQGLNARLIIDYDDLLSVRYVRAAGQGYEVMGFLTRRVGPLAPLARTFARPILRAEASRCAIYERQMLEVCDLALFTSAREAAVMGSDKAMAAPPLIAERPDVTAVGRRLIFLGNMHYAENAAMLRALAAAMPALGALSADVVIEVAGDVAPAFAERFERARFRFLGRVEDLSTLAGAGIFLAPVVGGSGVKLKVLDGMALGCPVVGTPQALEGLSGRLNRDALVVGDAPKVLRTAIALRDREALKLMLARRGQTYVRSFHALAHGAAVADAVAAAIARPR